MINGLLARKTAALAQWFSFSIAGDKEQSGLLHDILLLVLKFHTGFYQKTEILTISLNFNNLKATLKEESMENQFFNTKYGCLELESHSLHQSAVRFTTRDLIIPAGTKLPDQQILGHAVRLRKGTVLLPRFNSVSRDILYWQVFRYGLYEALRACLRIHDQYEDGRGGEIARLETAYEDFDRLARLLLQYRSLGPARRQRIERRLDDWWQKFEPAINRRKQETAELLGESQGILDAAGRPNPIATAEKIKKAASQLTLRLEEIRRIEPRIGMRTIALLLEKSRIERVFGRCYRGLRENHQASRSSSPINRKKRDEWGQKLIDLAQWELGSVAIGPFPAPVGRMRQELWRATHHLDKNEIQASRQLVWRVMQSLRCQAGRKRLEDFILKLDIASRRRRQPPLDSLVGQLDDFLQRLDTIDDCDFKAPVRAKVGLLVQESVAALKKNDLRGAKESLKKAARAL